MSEFEGLNWCLCGRHGYDQMEKKQIEVEDTAVVLWRNFQYHWLLHLLFFFF